MSANCERDLKDYLTC